MWIRATGAAIRRTPTGSSNRARSAAFTVRSRRNSDGDQINAVMSAVGYNLRLILKWLRKLLAKIIAAIWAAITPFSTLKQAS